MQQASLLTYESQFPMTQRFNFLEIKKKCEVVSAVEATNIQAIKIQAITI